MNFEVHLEYEGRTQTVSIESGNMPGGDVGAAAARAAMSLLAVLCADSHDGRATVSGYINDSGEPSRQADSVHVSVYLGPEVEVEPEGNAASGEVIQVSDAEDDPGDVSLHGQGRAVDRTSVDFDEIRATAELLRSSSADDYPGGPKKYGADQSRVLKAMNENPDEFRE